MALDVRVMGEEAAVRRVAAALGGVVDVVMKPRAYPNHRGDGVRIFGQARPSAMSGGSEVAVRVAAVALPTVTSGAGPVVGLRMTGDEAELLAVVTAARDLLRLSEPAQVYPENHGFGLVLYLRTHTGHLPEASPSTGTAVVPAGADEQGGRGRRWTYSERADRRTLPGRRGLPGSSR